MKGGELVALIPDLREFSPEDYALEIVTVDGESFAAMKAGDYLRYFPSSTMNAMEVPIEPMEGTTPGIIMYVAMGDNIDASTLDLEYRSHRRLTSEPLLWVSVAVLAIWLIELVNVLITSMQIRKYQERHERYDGKGYPEGRAGENIPFIARMICVADSFDAMNTNRVYRKMLTPDRVIEELESKKGLQFDPRIADVMLDLLREGVIAMER